MSAIKFSARIIASAAVALGLVASCGQLLGDYIVSVEETAVPANMADASPPPPEKICEAGVTECDGQVLRLCNEDALSWRTLEICATAELCESSDVSTVSACIPPACSADQMSCDNEVLRLCNISRTGWELFDTCESAAHCDAGRKQCLPAPCEPGDRRCNVGNLERCNDTRTAWEALDTCETNELCEVTLAPPTTVGEVTSTTQVPVPEVATNAEGPLECRGPVCVPREVRCEAALLLACNEGQTEFTVAEDCVTPKLCEASITYTGLRGSPRCVRPACAVGEHRCSPTGMLELCNAERDGFDPIEQCIGSPFCNAVAADSGLPGCEDAPCEAGEQQCNGPQIQVCTADRTQFLPQGAPCETRGLCNDDNPLGAFCQAPACQRGPFSGTEFRCEGATLLRCNDQHTGYDPINTCVTPALCNAGLGFAGCQAPVCAPGETRCNGNFVQRCNADRTAFVNEEQCMPGTCDGTLGRCADPCVLGSARCNTQGNLEQCRDRLVGWETTARCGSVQLCDSAGRTCRQPPAGCTADGVRRCRQQGQNTVLEVCTDGRSRFATLDTCAPGEICDVNDAQCDVCQQGSEPVCEGNDLATCAANGQTEGSQTCDATCQSVPTGPDRCRNCVPGETRCEGRQLVVCRQRNGQEVVDREDCDTAQLCQATLAACSGESCRCESSVCDPGERRCNGSQPEVCNAGQTGFVPDGPSCLLDDNCNDDNGTCFPCAVGDVACVGGSLFGCALDRSGFNVPIGAQRCVSDNNGERSQSCSGGTLVNTRCQGGTPECVEGFGCRECDPDDFDPECSSDTSTTVCLGGDVVPDACEGDSGCIDAVCSNANGCLTQSSPQGTACTRPGGGAGICDGAPTQPSCVQCLPNSAARDCDDGNVCTTDTCAGNLCSRTNNTLPCTLAGGAAGSCNGGTCLRRVCTPNTDTCTGALLQRCNADGTALTTIDDCQSAALCNPSGCGTPCDPADCDFGCNADQTACAPCNPAQCNGTDDATCSTRECSGTQCITQPLCEAALCQGGVCQECVGNAGCNNNTQVCVNNQCVAACNPAACPFGRCNAARTACDTCTPADCTGNPTPCTTLECNNGAACDTVPRDGLECGPNLICEGTECVAASGGGDPGGGDPGGGDPGGGGPGGGDPPGGGGPGGGDPPGGGGPGGGNGNDPDGDGPCDGVCDVLGDVLSGCVLDCL